MRSPSLPRPRALASALALLTVASVGEAEETPDKAPTANVFLASVAYQAPTNLEKEFPGGAGLVYTRDYFVTGRAALGIQAGARIFPTTPLHLALGYGLSIKHYVGRLGQSPSSGLYFRYGLLLQQNFVDGLSGSATGHDTHLAIGYDKRSDGLSPVFEGGYHLTQVRMFATDTIWWPYAELAAGLRF